MTEAEEWRIKEERGRRRFLVQTYTIKDRFYQPGAPFFVVAGYIDADAFGGISLDQFHETGTTKLTGE